MKFLRLNLMLLLLLFCPKKGGHAGASQCGETEGRVRRGEKNDFQTATWMTFLSVSPPLDLIGVGADVDVNTSTNTNTNASRV